LSRDFTAQRIICTNTIWQVGVCAKERSHPISCSTKRAVVIAFLRVKPQLFQPVKPQHMSNC